MFGKRRHGLISRVLEGCRDDANIAVEQNRSQDWLKCSAV